MTKYRYTIARPFGPTKGKGIAYQIRGVDDKIIGSSVNQDHARLIVEALNEYDRRANEHDSKIVWPFEEGL